MVAAAAAREEERMRRFAGIVYDEFVDTGSGTVFTSIDHALALASGRQISVLVVEQNPDTKNPAVINVAVWHSADGDHFKVKTNGVIVNAETVPIASQRTISGGEPNTIQPSMKYVRLAIWVGNGAGGAGTARVRIMATVRGTPDAEDIVAAEPEPMTAPRLVPGSMEAHARIVSSLMEPARRARSLPPGQRAAYFLAHITPEAKQHFLEVDRKLRALHPETRQLLMATSANLMRHAIKMKAAEGMGLACCPEETSPPGGCGCAPGLKS
jgi:hypothetical protein